MRLKLLLTSVVLPLLLWGSLPLLSQGQAPGRLQEREAAVRSKLGATKRASRLLTTDITAYSRRIERLQGSISGLQRRQTVLQLDLDAKRARLVRTQDRLRAERARLARLRARLGVAQKALSRRLVEIYTADKPDVLTVVLNSDGFADLLERSAFIRRISDQDREIVAAVRVAKRDATVTAARLDGLETRQQRVAAEILGRRDEIAEVKGELIGTRVGYQRTRAGKARALRGVRATRGRLMENLRAIEREQASVRAKLAAAARASASGTAAAAGPFKRGTGRLASPLAGPLTSPFGPRWGRLHAGIDISAPDGTPIRAADGGRAVIAELQGGYGNYTCIQHTATLTTCYAHQSRLGTSVGANVKQGQVMGYVGNTGNSFGAHLHFEVRVSGTPVDPAGYL